VNAEPRFGTQSSVDMGSGRSTMPGRGQNTAGGLADRQQQQQQPLRKRQRVQDSFAGSANVTPQTFQTQPRVEARQRPPVMKVESAFPEVKFKVEDDTDDY
jgi:hypothetical protein